MNILLRLILVAGFMQSQALVILVRDSAGNPLAGASLDILLAGPPHEPFTACVTDSAGQCDLQVPPGLYVVQFTGGWAGQSFIPTLAQNSGALDDGAAGDGFGVYVEEGAASPVITFVVASGPDGLVPLWDMSRDPELAPQPLFPPGFETDRIDLAPLSGSPSESQVTATPQIVIGAYELNPPPTQAATSSTSLDAATGGDTPFLKTMPVLAAVAVVALAALALGFRPPRPHQGKTEKRHG